LCTKAHASSSDANIFQLLPTDFSTWTSNWKQVCLRGKKKFKESGMHAINNLIFILAEKPNKAPRFIATQAMVSFSF